MEEQRKSLAKALVTTISVILVTGLAGAGLGLLGITQMWIPFLGLALWATIGQMKTDPKTIFSVWLGAGTGLVLMYLLRYPPAALGDFGFPVAMVLIVIFMTAMNMGALSLVFNMYCAIYMVAAMGATYDLTVWKEYLIGLLLCGILPMMILPLLKKKTVAIRTGS